MKRVVPLIKQSIESNEDLDNLYVSGEFGGSYVLWENGEEKHFIDPNIKVPQPLIEEAIAMTINFSSSHFVDTDKETMVSLEMNDGMTVEEFKPEQMKLANELKKIKDKYDADGKFEVHVDRIATNIRDKGANKSYATKQVVEWINTRLKNKPNLYIALGDSKSDLEIPKELQRLDLPFEFVFVGGYEQLQGQTIEFPINITKNYCDDGVVEFIQNFKNGN